MQESVLADRVMEGLSFQMFQATSQDSENLTELYESVDTAMVGTERKKSGLIYTYPPLAVDYVWTKVKIALPPFWV